MPFCIQSPLLVQISIYTVACFLTETRHLDKQQSILIKGQTIRMLNDRLRSPEDAISDTAIAGVCQMIVDECKQYPKKQTLVRVLPTVETCFAAGSLPGALFTFPATGKG